MMSIGRSAWEYARAVLLQVGSTSCELFFFVDLSMVANRALSRCAPGPRLLGALPRPSPLGEGRAVRRRRRSERKKERKSESASNCSGGFHTVCENVCVGGGGGNCSGKYHGKLEKQGR